MNKLIQYLIVGLLIIPLIGCDESSPTEQGLESPSIIANPSGSIDLSDRQLSFFDAELVRLNEMIPGFGGMFLNEEGVLVIWITSEFFPDVTIESILPMVQETPLYPEESIQAENISIQEGKYTFKQLVKWKLLVRERLADSDVHGVGAGERENRVVLAIKPDANEESVLGTVEMLGIPPEAVELWRQPPIMQMKGNRSPLNAPAVTSSVPQGDLDDYIRPIRGGLEIGFSQSLCTMAVVSKYKDGPYTKYGFLTNSHCTNTQGGTESTQYTQDAQSGTTIAEELYDPQYFSCQGNRLCRYSDAAFATFDGFPYQQFDFGAVYLPANPGQNQSSLAIDSEADTDDWGSYGTGYLTNKVGRTTGWTQGPVVITGMDYDQYEEGPFGNPVDTGITLLDNNVVEAGSGSGDSGSAVFQINSSNSVLRLSGILWGGGSNQEGDLVFVYSTGDNIVSELPDGTDVQD